VANSPSGYGLGHMRRPSIWPREGGAMKLTPSLFPISLLTLLLVSCAISHRIKEHQAEFDTYPPEVQKLIKSWKIREGFTKTKVYIALGQPYSQTEDRWTYAASHAKSVQTAKPTYQYQSEYETAYKDYLKEKQKHKHATFSSPDPYTTTYPYRRYVHQYLHFKDDVLQRIEYPDTTIWLDSDWH